MKQNYLIALIVILIGLLSKSIDAQSFELITTMVFSNSISWVGFSPDGTMFAYS